MASFLPHSLLSNLSAILAPSPRMITVLLLRPTRLFNNRTIWNRLTPPHRFHVSNTGWKQKSLRTTTPSSSHSGTNTPIQSYGQPWSKNNTTFYKLKPRFQSREYPPLTSTIQSAIFRRFRKLYSPSLPFNALTHAVRHRLTAGGIFRFNLLSKIRLLLSSTLC